MVAPVTDLGSSVLQDDSTNYKYVSRWKQAMPVDRPLPYVCKVGKKLKQISGDPVHMIGVGQAANRDYDSNASLQADLKGKVHDKLMGSIREGASLGAGLAELGKSIGMVNARLVQIAQFTRRLRKLDFNGAAHVLSLPRAPKGVSKSKSMAGNWLEYSFGWKPAIQDIYTAIDVLQEPIRSIKPKESSSGSFLKSYGDAVSTTQPFHRFEYVGLTRLRAGLEVTVTNHNLFLANRLGLINPGTVLWEVIPFSFVVDWFINVEQFLSSGTDYVGLGVSNAWFTHSTSGIVLEQKGDPNWDVKVHMASYQIGVVDRRLGTINPVLQVRPFKLFGWQRCAHSAALLTVLLGRK